MSVVMQSVGTHPSAVGRAVVLTAMTGAAPPPEAVTLTVPDPAVIGPDADIERVKRSTSDAAHAYRLIGDTAGDASSVMSLAGAGLLVARPIGDRTAHGVVIASFAAGGIDTAVQIQRWAAGEKDANFGTTVYAATGLLPGASLIALKSLKHIPAKGEIAELATVGANLALIGYETVHRVPRMVDGTEDTSGYLSFAAGFSGIVVRMRH